MGSEGVIGLLAALICMLLGGLLGRLLGSLINLVWRRESLSPWPVWLFVFVGVFTFLAPLALLLLQ